MEQTLIDFDPRLQGPFSMIIAGPSGCGKTELISQIIDNADNLINPKIDKIVYYYGCWQDAFGRMNSKINFKEGLPTSGELNPATTTNATNGQYSSHTLCIIDDLMSESDKKVVADLFTKGSHHWKVSVVYVTQNIYEKTSKDYRTMSLNANYIVAFKNPRDMSQIRYLFQQAFPHKPKLLTEIYNMETRKPHSYILIGFKQNTPDQFRVRSSVTTPNNQLVFF